MPQISTRISVIDAMTPAINAMYRGTSQLISGMEMLNRASGKAFDISAFREAQSSFAEALNIQRQVADEYREIEERANNANSAQRNYNNTLSRGAGNASLMGNNLISGLRRYISLAAAVYTGKELVEASDKYTSNTARLDLITESPEEREDLQKAIYEASKSSRGGYNDSISSVAKLGLLAGDAFDSNEEAVRFTELMQKSFKLSGASTQEQQSAMYQLTQAMAAGKLQGDEFRSIMENAPMLAQSIADYTGKSKGELKEMSSEGTITADIIKNALFAAADDIESKFSTLPVTFGDSMMLMGNEATLAFAPVYEQLNGMLNGELGQGIMGGLSEGLPWLAGQAEEVLNWIDRIVTEGLPNLALTGETIKSIIADFTGAGGALNIISRNIVSILSSEGFRTGLRTGANALSNISIGLSDILRIMSPLLPYVTGTYIAFKSYSVLSGILNGVVTSIQGIYSSFVSVTPAIESATMAQQTFNAVSNANVFLAIAGAILGIASAWHAVSSASRDAASSALTADYVVNTALKNAQNNIAASEYAKQHDVDLNTAKAILASNDEYQEQIEALEAERDKLRYSEYSIYNPTSAEIEEQIERKDVTGWSYDKNDFYGPIDAINDTENGIGNFWSNMAYFGAKDTFWTFKIDNALNPDSEYSKKQREYDTQIAELIKQRDEEEQKQMTDYKKIKEMFDEDDSSNQNDEMQQAGSTPIDVNVVNTVDIASEDLKYMRELAEQEAINEFTSKLIQPNINVSFGEVKETADVDGIISRITDGLVESLNNSSDVVHI